MMNVVEVGALLVGLPVGMVLANFSLPVQLSGIFTGERRAAARGAGPSTIPCSVTRGRLHRFVNPRTQNKPGVLQGKAINRTKEKNLFIAEPSNPTPGHLVVPLIAGKFNFLGFITSPAPDGTRADPFDFAVQELRIEMLP
jgi:hypothetical protein